MKINGLRRVLLLLAPLCLAWNGQGTGALTWSPDTHAPGVVLQVDAVASVHDGTVEVVVVLPVPNLDGDGILSVQVSETLRNRGPLGLPHAEARLRFREYGPDGTTLFRGIRVEAGTLTLIGPATGPLRFEVDAVLTDGLQARRLAGAFDLVPLVAEEDTYTDPETGAAEVVYHTPSGCGGTWDDTEDDPQTVDWEDEDSSGCEGDDVGSDGPSGSGGCGDNEYPTDDSGSDGTGCEGDSLDGEATDSGCDCGDDLATAAAVCSRMGKGGGPSSPWKGRMIGWLPWFVLFGFLGIFRLRVALQARIRVVDPAR